MVQLTWAYQTTSQLKLPQLKTHQLGLPQLQLPLGPQHDLLHASGQFLHFSSLL